MGIQCFVVFQWGNLMRLVNFYLMNCAVNINSLTVAIS